MLNRLVICPPFLYLCAMEIIINSLDTIQSAAKDFITAVHLADNPAQVFAFHGKMGAGKTTFIKALCEALGVEDVVNSPTFAIVNEYYSDLLARPIYHFDFYRIKHLAEAVDIGTDDYFYAPNPSFIEWPELVEELLPPHTTVVTIEEMEDGRRRVSFE